MVNNKRYGLSGVVLGVLLVGAASVWALDANDPALVGMWLCDEGSGDTLVDSSPNGNDAAINGSFDWIDGKFGGGIKANGGGSIDVPTSDSVNSISEQLTVAAFFRVDADSDTGIRRNGAFLLEDQSASEPVPDGWSFRIWTDQGLSPGIYSTTELDQGTWYHIAGVWDGEVMKLYINGVAEKELLTAGGAPTDGKWGGKIPQPGNPLQLKFGSESYTGGMDEIVIFNRALDETEVQALVKGWTSALAVRAAGKLATTWAVLKL